MIKLIAVLCSLADPSVCVEKTVTTSDMGVIREVSCQVGMPQLAKWMEGFPAWRLAGWKCQLGERSNRVPA